MAHPVLHTDARSAHVWPPAAARAWFWLLPLAYLWWVLIRQLSVPWNTNPQYAYGWAVPFLCVYLIWQRGANPKSEIRNPKSETHELPPAMLHVLCGVLALLYAPTRLIQQANPEWSLVSWALAIEVIGLTIVLVHGALRPAASGRAAIQASPSSREPQPSAASFRGPGFQLQRSDFSFPVCFFLVAVPWPYFLEHPVIQGLTRLNTALTLEILGWLGIPGVQHGNVIELATGSVGVDEACSGIRSLQATLMLSLFFGDLYLLRPARRCFCVAAGFVIALICNLGRTLLLTWVASRQGVGAIAGWHDPAGVTILIACFLGLWLVSLKLRQQGARASNKRLDARDGDSGGTASPAGIGLQGASLEDRQPATSGGAKPDLGQQSTPRNRQLRLGVLGVSLASWLVLVESGVAAWYQHVDAQGQATSVWTVAWPTHATGYKEVPIAQPAVEMLHYDEARQAQWTEDGRFRWQLGWFYWKPGRTAGYLAKSHNPLVCMPAAGYTVASVSSVQFADINGLRLPFRMYSFDQAGMTVHVLYTRWEDRATEQSFATEGVSGFNRLRSVWRGRGNHGQRVMSLAVWGVREDATARDLLIRQLRSVIHVLSPSAGNRR